jgi:hypothetical protein
VIVEKQHVAPVGAIHDVIYDSRRSDPSSSRHDDGILMSKSSATLR